MQNRKEQLIDKLTQKVIKLENEFSDSLLRKNGEELYEGETSYSQGQRFLVRKEIDESKVPLEIKVFNKVLRNIEKDKILKIANINDNTQFPIYCFLEALQKPASEYVKGASKEFSLVNFLVINYDPEFPRDEDIKEDESMNAKEARIMEEMKYTREESRDIYLDVKNSAIEKLQEAFVKRGIPEKRYSKHNFESVSQIITPTRYEYLNKLAVSFKNSPYSLELIDFINQLPSNSWFECDIKLKCDNFEEFEDLRKKYIPDYKTLKESVSAIEKGNTTPAYDDIPF
jgi:hypothetical protein